MLVGSQNDFTVLRATGFVWEQGDVDALRSLGTILVIRPYDLVIQGNFNRDQVSSLLRGRKFQHRVLIRLPLRLRQNICRA